LDLEVEERKNKLISDSLPDDSGHLITVELSYGVIYLDFSALHKILFYKKDMSSILSTHLLSISDESIILLAPNFFTLFSKNVKKYNIYVIIF